MSEYVLHIAEITCIGSSDAIQVKIITLDSEDNFQIVEVVGKTKAEIEDFLIDEWLEREELDDDSKEAIQSLIDGLKDPAYVCPSIQRKWLSKMEEIRAARYHN